MPSLKDIKTRISSVKKTKQITSAMNLVAGAKLRKATERAVNARPYQEKLSSVLGRVAGKAGEQFSDPLLEPRAEVKRIHVTILTSDRGLCGPFNNNLMRKTVTWLEGKRRSGIEFTLRAYGRKADDYLSNRGYDAKATTGYDKVPKMDLVRDLANELTDGFATGEFDEAWIIYNQFENVLVQTPTFEQVMPISVPETGGDDTLIDHRYEPDAGGLLSKLLPLYLRTLLLQSFLETEAGEHAARMTAMDNATRNASDLIDALTLQYNRARQAAITTELVEIVAGAEAL